MPVHVSSTMCSSSGGQNCVIQHMVLSHLSRLPAHSPLHDDTAYLITSIQTL